MVGADGALEAADVDHRSARHQPSRSEAEPVLGVGEALGEEVVFHPALVALPLGGGPRPAHRLQVDQPVLALQLFELVAVAEIGRERGAVEDRPAAEIGFRVAQYLAPDAAQERRQPGAGGDADPEARVVGADRVLDRELADRFGTQEEPVGGAGLP